MNSYNPVLQQDTFKREGITIDVTNAMTVQGVIVKSAILLFCVLLTAGYTWIQFFKSHANPASVSTLMTVGVFGGFALAMATVFKKEWAPVTSVFYALCEGLFLGGISAMLEVKFQGVVIQAAMLTFGTLGAMLFAYQTGVIRATEKFKLGVVAATGGIALTYLIALVLSFFGMPLSFIWGGGMVGIIFSLFVVGIAALNLVLDFDLIEQGAKRGAPKYMEWYGAFALMVTLVWLYIEMLRLLSKLREK